MPTDAEVREILEKDWKGYASECEDAKSLHELSLELADKIAWLATEVLLARTSRVEERLFMVTCNEDGDVYVSACTDEQLEKSLVLEAPVDLRGDRRTFVKDLAALEKIGGDPMYWGGARVLIRGVLVAPVEEDGKVLFSVRKAQ